MEVADYMKNVIIFASQECCSGMLEVSLLNSLYTVEHIAKDIDVVSEELNTNGYNAYVYYLHNNTHVENKRSISQNVKKATAGVPGGGDREGLGHHLPATSYLQGSRCDPLHQLLGGSQ